MTKIPPPMPTADLARLIKAGVNYPWYPQQTLEMLNRAETAEEEVIQLLLRIDAQKLERKRLQRVILETSQVFTDEEMDRVLED
jgi:hypothetical protein